MTMSTKEVCVIKIKLNYKIKRILCITYNNFVKAKTSDKTSTYNCKMKSKLIEGSLCQIGQTKQYIGVRPMQWIKTHEYKLSIGFCLDGVVLYSR